MEDRLLWKDPMLEQGKNESFPQGGRSGRDNVLDATSCSPSPCTTGGEKLEKSRRLSLGRSEGLDKGVVRFSFYFSVL